MSKITIMSPEKDWDAMTADEREAERASVFKGQPIYSADRTLVIIGAPLGNETTVPVLAFDIQNVHIDKGRRYDIRWLIENLGTPGGAGRGRMRIEDAALVTATADYTPEPPTDSG